LLGHPVERREHEPQQLRAVAVVLDAAGVVAGWRLADPIVGVLITVASVVVLHDAAREVYRRLMDAVDPPCSPWFSKATWAVDRARITDPAVP
jgi:divalent metal cation (Fe/Co/Zn/Cd) transporter